MKYSDPIVDEVRAIRDAIVKECNYDIETLAQLLKAHEAQSGRKTVRRPSRPVKIQKTS